jgi:hypothetical protein
MENLDDGSILQQATQSVGARSTQGVGGVLDNVESKGITRTTHRRRVNGDLD